MKKKLIRIITGIILIVLILIGLFAYKQMHDYTNIIKLNRGIEIPKELGYKELYSIDQGASFHGDGIRYHVYSYENEEVAETMVDWRNALHDKPYFELIEEREREIKVDVKYMPPLAQIINIYHQKKEDNSEILILRSDINKTLYIFESFL